LGDRRLPAAAKLTGRVSDDAGKPVAGARVIALAATGGLSDGEALYLAETKTGPDGAFAMPDAPDGSRVLSARAPGLAPMTRFALEAHADERLVLQRGGTVRGTLTDAAGKPVSGAVVVCEEVAARTDSGGAFRLAGVPYGSRTIETVWKDDLAARKEGVEVPRDAEAEVTLKLARAASIAGSVVDEATKRPIAGVRISLQNPGRNFGRRPAQRLARTDARGQFKAGGLGSHHYTVQASRDGYLTASIPNVAASLSAPGTVAVALQTAATLAGCVVDDTGQAISCA